MLETERLLIRKFVSEDLDALIRLRADPEVNKYLGGERLQNAEALEKRLQFYIDCYDRYGFGICAMIWKKTDEMIGWSGLQPLEQTSEIEVGYGMAKQYWGRGIGFECAKRWLDYGFGIQRLERIVAVAYPENKASRKIMEKLGMKYEKSEIHYGTQSVFYAIARDEFFHKFKQII